MDRASITQASPPEKHMRIRHFGFFLSAIVCLYFCGITFFSILKILTYKTSFDLAVFDQTFWMMMHTGIPHVTTQPPFEELNAFGWHFSPVFYFLLPIYALIPSPFTLQIIQCASYSLAAIPVAYALRMKVADGIALGITGILLFNPFYLNASLWEFHESSLACPLIGLAYWALLTRAKRIFLLCLFLLVLTKEHYGLCAAGFGLLWWRHNHDGRFGLWVAALGGLAFIFILGFAMPVLLGSTHPMVDNAVTPRYNWLFSPDAHLFSTLYKLLFTTSLGISGLGYLCALGVAFAGMPFLAPLYMLPAAGDVAAALLSTNPLPKSWLSYHSAGIIIVLAIASGFGIAQWGKTTRGQTRPAMLLSYIAVIALITTCLFHSMGIYQFELNKRAETVDFDIVRKITPVIGNAPVSVQPNIGFLFSERPGIYRFPAHADRCDFIILYLRHPYSDPNFNPFSTLYSYQLPADHYRKITELLGNPEWKIALWDNNWLLLEKNAGSEPDGSRSNVMARLAELQAGASTLPKYLAP